MSIRIVRVAAEDRGAPLAEGTAAYTHGAETTFELHYDPHQIFGDDRFIVETYVHAASQTCLRRGPGFVLTWGAFAGVTLSPDMLIHRAGRKAVCGPR